MDSQDTNQSTNCVSITTTAPVGTRVWKLCPECAQKLEVTWKFCVGCGNQVGVTTLWHVFTQPSYPYYPLTYTVGFDCVGGYPTMQTET